MKTRNPIVQAAARMPEGAPGAKKAPPVKKNEQLVVTVDNLSLEGAGIARVDGFTLFVSGALPGETVTALILKVQPNMAFAKCISVETPSPDRVAPACAAFPACGGCTLLHLAYPAQLAYKERAVRDALSRIGGQSAPEVRPIIGMAEPYRYRNKGSFPFAPTPAGAAFGFFAPRSHRLVPLSDCPIQDARITDAARRVSEWANLCNVRAYDEETGRGVLRHVVARVTSDGALMVVVVVTTAAVRQREALIDMLSDADSLYLNVNARDTNVICGEEYILLSGAPVLTQTLCALRFLVSPQTFMQVNTIQTERLYEAAAELLNPLPDEHVADIYCGMGSISLLLARRAGRVTGVESVPEAVADAEKNAAENGVDNARFLCGDAAALLPALLSGPDAPAAVVLDPPRKGCDAPVLDALIHSGVSRLVYVSCNPATLARDVKALSAGGFRLVTAQPVDMFPHTGHVECVVELYRQTPDKVLTFNHFANTQIFNESGKKD